MGRFWQILAVFDSFGQFWAEFAALVVADCMLEFWLKSLKPHTF
jgi:succinate-acetate transporter protein